MRTRLIQIVTPAARGSHGGNRVTALRWARALRRLGHRVRIGEHYTGGACDLLIALHAGKSHDSVVRVRREQPDAQLIVALTGTDLYVDLASDPRVAESLKLASRVVVLQERALLSLAAPVRDKARVIVQSASGAQRSTRPAQGFVVCVLAHLREVKDPLCAARAARRLPAESSVVVVHAGKALDEELGRQARRESERNPRYRWLGDLPRAQALRLLAGSDLLVVSSLAEGGANVVTEAIACGIPVVSTRIDGSIGLLGDDHPGYFSPGDTEALADLLFCAERDADFRSALVERSRRLAPLVDPQRELETWRALLEELEQKGGDVTELRLTRLVQGGG